MKNNNIRRIRKLLHLSPSVLAKLAGCSSSHIYALESGRQELNELLIMKLSRAFNCEPSYLCDDFNDLDFLQKQSSSSHSIMQTNCVNISSNITAYETSNLREKKPTQDEDAPIHDAEFSINYYNNLTDFSNNSNVLTKTYDLQTLRIITNNKPVFDYSKIVLCRDNDITYICNIVNIVQTDKPMLCVIENKIDADNTTRFIASVRRDVLTNKIMLTIEGQQEMIIPITCTVIGVVICRIC